MSLNKRQEARRARALGAHQAAKQLDNDVRVGLAYIALIAACIAGGVIGGITLGIPGVVVGVCLALFVGLLCVINSNLDLT